MFDRIRIRCKFDMSIGLLFMKLKIRFSPQWFSEKFYDRRLTSACHVRCPRGVLHFSNHFIIFVVEAFFFLLRQQQIVHGSQAIDLWPDRCISHNIAYLKNHEVKLFTRQCILLKTLRTSSIVIFACGLLSLLY